MIHLMKKISSITSDELKKVVRSKQREIGFCNPGVALSEACRRIRKYVLCFAI